jgi:hypothetical protein
VGAHLFSFSVIHKSRHQERAASNDEDGSNVRMASIEHHEEPHYCQYDGEEELSKSFRTWILPHPSPLSLWHVPIEITESPRDDKVSPFLSLVILIRSILTTC